MVRQAMLRKEARVARGHNALARQQSRMAMVRVEAIPLPRVVAQHDLWPDLANDAGDFATLDKRAAEFAVDVTEEAHLAGAVGC